MAARAPGLDGAGAGALAASSRVEGALCCDGLSDFCAELSRWREEPAFLQPRDRGGAKD